VLVVEPVKTHVISVPQLQKAANVSM